VCCSVQCIVGILGTVLNTSVINFNFVCAQRQYGQMVGCVKGLQVISKCCHYRRWRPYVTVHENTRAWWHYAARCLTGGWPHSAPGSWEVVLQRARDNIAYVEMYCRILSCPTAALPPDMKQLKDAMELERSLEDLQLLREVST